MNHSFEELEEVPLDAPIEEEIPQEEKESKLDNLVKLCAEIKFCKGVNPASAWFRYAVLLLACFITFGAAVSYDSIGAIAPYLQEALGIGQGELGLLIAIYSLPNLVMVFVGGILIDKFGPNRSGILFSIVVTLGTAIVAFSNSYAGIVVGRLIFGLGSESLYLCQTAFLAKWFANKEIAFALSCGLAFGRVASIFTLWTLPVFAEQNWKLSLWFAVLICLVSFVCNIVLVGLDVRGTQILRENEKPTEEIHTSSHFSFKALKKEIKSMPANFWVLFAVVMLYYATVVTYTSFTTDFITDVYKFDPNTAAQAASIVYFISLVLSLVVGWSMDYFGHRVLMMLAGTAICIPTFLCLSFGLPSPYVYMVILGISFSVVIPALWAIPTLIVKPKLIGIGYGILGCAQNSAHFFSPILYGYIRNATGSWQIGTLIYAAFVVLATALIAVIWYFDHKHHAKLLQSPSIEMKKLTTSA